MYRPGDESVVDGDGYTLTFIELDDQGELWDPAQVSRAARVASEHGQDPDGVIVLLFVHGWNHDASADDKNVAGFERQLAWVAAGQRAAGVDRPRHVVGVYVGWRGQASRWSAFNVLSFYGRQGAAGRIAGLTATEAIYRVLGAARGNPRTRVVLIGHSFGGKILEAALSQALVGQVLERSAGGEAGAVDFPADLVFMLNPAAQSLHAKQFIDILERQRLRLYRTDEGGEIRLERPLIISLTSKGDLPTRLWFRAGLTAKAINKRFRDYGAASCGAGQQRRFFTRTPGNNRFLLSHEVEVDRIGDADGILSLDALQSHTAVRYDPEARSQFFEISGSRYRFRIRKLGGAYNDTPYWVMRVPRAVMPNHSDIFGPDLQELLQALMIVTGGLEPDARTIMAHETGVRPLGIAPAIGGGILFLDRSRRIYRVAPGLDEPTFWSCLPSELAEVGSSLGFSAVPGELWAGRLEQDLEGDAAQTVLYRMRTRDEPEVDARVVVSGAMTGSVIATTFDIAGGRVFLARSDAPEIEMAHLRERGSIESERLVSLPMPAVRTLVYAPAGNQLFAGDGERTVLRIRLDGTPSIEQVANDLDFPTATAWDGERHRLYVATAGDRTIWRFDCAGPCSEPRPFAENLDLVRPEQLVVTDDGSLWVGDLAGQAMLALRPDGSLLCDHRELPAD